MRAVDLYAERIRGVPPIVADAALAAAILVLDIVELILFRDAGNPVPNPWGFAVFAVLCLGLLVRRRYVWVTFALLQGWSLLGVGFILLFHDVTLSWWGAGFLSLTILATVIVYSVADRAPGWAAALVVLAFVYDVWQGDVLGGAPPLQSLLRDAIYYTPVWVLPAFAGWSQRRRRKLTAQLEVRADDVRREREWLAEQAVATERIQIARELRALVSQGVERMTGQARTARRRLETRSSETQQGIAAIEATGRRALVEMRRLLLVLRRGEPQAAEGLSIEPAQEAEVHNTGVPEARSDLPAALARLPAGLRRPWVVDWCLVLMLSGFMAGEFIVWGPSEGIGTIFVGWVPRVLAAVILGALLVRRKVPFSMLCVIAVAVFVWMLHQGDIPGAAEQSLLWATYTVAAYKKPRWAGAAVALAIFSWSAHHRCLCMVHIGAFATFAALAGVAMNLGRRLNRQIENQTDLLVRTRRERVRLAVEQERTRVAREMHDLVAHSVTAMVVQAGAARMVAETDPAQAQGHLEQIEETGVDAMRELGILNATLDPASTPLEQDRSSDAPNVRALVNRFRRTGQAVHLIEEGEPPPVDQGLRISVYRIVQEALTNVQKHAQGAPATVSIRYQPNGIEIEVANSAAPTVEAGTLPGAGQGLMGIRERAWVFGGRAEAGQTTAGGFRVYVHLPAELVPA